MDLVLLSMMLHELSQETRAAVLTEVKRVLKPGGWMLVLDYHPGPLRFPRGWLGKPVIILVERIAGREHFRHYREFLAAGGMPTVAARHGLQVETSRVIKGGNFALFLLRPRQTKERTCTTCSSMTSSPTTPSGGWRSARRTSRWRAPPWRGASWCWAAR